MARTPSNRSAWDEESPPSAPAAWRRPRPHRVYTLREAFLALQMLGAAVCVQPPADDAGTEEAAAAKDSAQSVEYSTKRH